MKGVALAAALVCLPGLTVRDVAAQQKYPEKPIRILTPFAPGGGSDTLARLIGPHITEAFGQSIIVDNRPGGGGSLGATIAAKADPDGYTLIVVSASYGANAVLHDLPFDSVTGIDPIILFGETGLLVAMHPSSPIHSIPELIAHLKSHPGKLNFGSAGTGGLGHLAGELFKLKTKVSFTHVPYKGSGPVMNALLAAEVHSSFSSLVPSIPHVKAGRLRPLGITTPKRSRALPDVPTIGETVPGYEVTHWYGLWGPKGIPKAIIQQWNTQVGKILRTRAMQKWFENEGMEIAGGPPAQFQNRIKDDVEKWHKVVQEAHLSLRK
jgi:tripartite-type tricarboxylate transporter receptor subunit TctC